MGNFYNSFTCDMKTCTYTEVKKIFDFLYTGPSQYRERGDSYREQRNDSYRERGAPRGGSARGAPRGHSQAPRGRQPNRPHNEPLKFEGEFDFESANAQFDKEEIERELKQKLTISKYLIWEDLFVSAPIQVFVKCLKNNFSQKCLNQL